jgi:hypothetical protein
MKIGISIKLDVTKIDKARLFKGEKGTYLDLTTFVELDEADQYGNHGFIAQEQSKEERDSGAEKPPILGNCKVFWRGESVNQTAAAIMRPEQAGAAPAGFADLENDIPFDLYDRGSFV